MKAVSFEGETLHKAGETGTLKLCVPGTKALLDKSVYTYLCSRKSR